MHASDRGSPHGSEHEHAAESPALLHTTSGTDSSPVLERFIGAMSCPKCTSDLKRMGSHILCVACGTKFPIREGIPILATYGSSETWANEASSSTSCDYQNQYQGLAAATNYNEAYRDKPTKRWSTQREIGLLKRLLSGQPRCESLLNIPSGGGRLSETIAAKTDNLLEADTAFGQVLYARDQSSDMSSRLWMTASAFHIPFKDNSVDGAVCCRLCHHLPTAVERDRLVAELLRVARRFVIMTFFDYYSPKNYLRRIRQPFNKKPPKMTMTRKRLSQLASQHGARLVESPALAYPFSGHRYALMVKHGSEV